MPAHERARAAQIKYRSKDPEAYRRMVREAYKGRKATRNIRLREAHAADPTIARARHLKRKYDLTLVGWLSRLYFQGEKCACCGTPKPSGKGWHTDHDHQTGRVRGLLCDRCNRLLGALGDTSEAVSANCSAFLAYLERVA